MHVVGQLPAVAAENRKMRSRPIHAVPPNSAAIVTNAPKARIISGPAVYLFGVVFR